MAAGFFFSGWAWAAAALPPLSAAEIVARMVEKNQRRQQLLEGYRVERLYHLRSELSDKESLMRVQVVFESPATVRFDIRSNEGSGFIATRVWKRIMEAERDSREPERRRLTAITPENYTFALQGQEEIRGRLAYVLGVRPLREDPLLFVGRIWVDAQDFAVARVEGTVSKRPSFWIRKIEIVRNYKKIGPFWLPQRTEGTVEVLLLGTFWVDVTNGDYRVRLHNTAAGPTQ
ncbi:MAG: hypothetical protein ACE5IP_05745 [Terriglobia bacterium]